MQSTKISKLTPALLPLISDGCLCPRRCYQSHRIRSQTLERHRTSPLNADKEKYVPETLQNVDKRPPNAKFLEQNPEFLPRPDWAYRDRLCEMLERRDMYSRRRNIIIPEFYVGSVLAVTVADKNEPGKSSRFLGICIEVMYEIYSPVIQKIEVIRLEKRLDKELFYLRDCPHEFSYFPQDMEPAIIHKGMDVPVNQLKVKLNMRPWSQRWERHELQGVEPFTGWKDKKQKDKIERLKNHPQVQKPWEKHDIMKHYRESINPVDTKSIYAEVEENSKDWKVKTDPSDTKEDK
ncbi:RM19-like protein [Mya arenaria]|uniref:Large ribosomal subunit protein bL19m n=1 Tax=Mya arenaria TaxID=6604 RepID=A0ABY7EEF7_MYAAR|nr:RM19-like protein [Mya arenaria]